VRRAGQERSERDDSPYAAALGQIEERGRIRTPSLMGLRATKEQEAVTALRGSAREELALRPVNLAALVGPHLHVRPFLGEHDQEPVDQTFAGRLISAHLLGPSPT
jgi:hypothetical protein